MRLKVVVVVGMPVFVVAVLKPPLLSVWNVGEVDLLRLQRKGMRRNLFCEKQEGSQLRL